MQEHVRYSFTREENDRFLSDLKLECTKAGFLEPAYMYYLIKLCILVLVLCTLLILAWTATRMEFAILLSIASTFLLAQIAYVGHDASHNSIGPNRVLNALIGQISMSIFAGLAFEEWAARHNDHHKFVQIDDLDPDMAGKKVVSLTRAAMLTKSKLLARLTSNQAIYIWALSPLFAHGQRYSSQFRAMKSPMVFRYDLMWVGLHYIFWIGIPLYFLDVSIGRTLLVYFLPCTILGIQLASVFWTNHIGMPLVATDSKQSWVSHQVQTTRNVNVHPLMDFYFGGVNFGIEHHLLPRCPSKNLRKLQPINQQLVERSGLTYESDSWWNIIRKIYKHLSEVAKVE